MGTVCALNVRERSTAARATHSPALAAPVAPARINTRATLACTHPLHPQVAEVFTGTPGKYVPLENTIKDFKGVLEVRRWCDGEYQKHE